MIWKTCAVFCTLLLMVAQIARSDEEKPGANPAKANSASAYAALKAGWPMIDAPTRRVKEDGIPNFGKLNDRIWRSGQPNQKGYQRLAALGVKTVINLREEFPGDKEMIPEGVQYIYLPIKDDHAPTEEQGKRFLEIAANPDNWPILVHCHGGEGRAGVMAALVRHSFDGWKLDLIMQEVGNFRTKHLGFITTRMAGGQQTFIRRWTETNPAGGYLTLAPAN